MRTTLIGLNNPHSADPRRALEPHPQGSAGYRLARMFLDSAQYHGLRLSFDDYVDGFVRKNILNSCRWDDYLAQKEADQVFETLRGGKVVCCGRKVAQLLDLPRTEWLYWSSVAAIDYCVIPHPSGLTREYNDPFMRRAVGDLLLQLYKESQHVRCP